jgi:DNA-binding MarR family transcriptional regulator
MPKKRDPFADKRKTSNGVRPKQATTQIKRKLDRNYKRRYKVERDLKAAEVALTTTERELLVKKQMLDLISEAPSPAEQRKIIMATFMESNFNPIEALIDMAMDETADLTDKDRAGLMNNLASYFAPKPKSLDLQADMKSSVNINVMDFSKVTQADLVQKAIESEVIDIVNEDDDYNEFEAPEDQLAK